jgi:hypothetical protein
VIHWDRLGKRHEAFSYLYAELPQNCFIVETGSIRTLGNWEGDGQSTIVWNEIAADRSGSVLTIDIDPVGAELVAELGLSHTTAITSDSLLILPNIITAVDFLYLDSFDVDFDHPQPAADHHLRELHAAAHCLKPGAIVAVDDNQESGGKGSEVASYFAALNVPEIICGYVRAWRIPDGNH